LPSPSLKQMHLWTQLNAVKLLRFEGMWRHAVATKIPALCSHCACFLSWQVWIQKQHLHTKLHDVTKDHSLNFRNRQIFKFYNSEMGLVSTCCPKVGLMYFCRSISKSCLTTPLFRPKHTHPALLKPVPQKMYSPNFQLRRCKHQTLLPTERETISAVSTFPVY